MFVPFLSLPNFKKSFTFWNDCNYIKIILLGNYEDNPYSNLKQIRGKPILMIKIPLLHKIFLPFYTLVNFSLILRNSQVS